MKKIQELLIVKSKITKENLALRANNAMKSKSNTKEKVHKLIHLRIPSKR